MTSHDSSLTYPFAEPPGFGQTVEVAHGVHWLRMPLPMSLNHINLYLLEDDSGWTIVDTGIRGEETRNHWRKVFENCFKGKPVTQIICTHMHPDHTGQAGFLSDRWRAPLLMSCSEYYQARVMGTMMQDDNNWSMSDYFERAGLYLQQCFQIERDAEQLKKDARVPGAAALTSGHEFYFFAFSKVKPAED